MLVLARTALHNGAQKCPTDIMQFLSGHGGDILVCDGDHLHSHFSVCWCYLSTVQVLRAKSARSAGDGAKRCTIATLCRTTSAQQHYYHNTNVPVESPPKSQCTPLHRCITCVLSTVGV